MDDPQDDWIASRVPILLNQKSENSRGEFPRVSCAFTDVRPLDRAARARMVQVILCPAPHDPQTVRMKERTQKMADAKYKVRGPYRQQQQLELIMHRLIVGCKY